MVVISSYILRDSRCNKSTILCILVLDAMRTLTDESVWLGLYQSCPWVGLTRGLGWVGLGWVGNGSKICVFSGLGWVMGLK